MPRAQNLTQLSEIREHNRFILDAITNVSATALGRKNGDGDPAILVFVDRKIGEPWLPPSHLVPATLSGSQNLECLTDVISTETNRDFWLRTFFDRDGAEERLPLARFPSLVDTDRLRGTNLRLRDQLRGAGDTLTPGSQLSYLNRDGKSESGTLACFARHRQTQSLGFLTNQHVGDFVGNVLWHPDLTHRPVGVVQKSVHEQTPGDLYGASIPEVSVEPVITVDAAFCELHPSLEPRLIDPRLPTVNGDRIEHKRLNQPFRLHSTTMGPIGEAVLGVGINRGRQEGRVTAVGFEFHSGGLRYFTDYLIVGENSTEFSDPGDSGKLVVTKDRREPLAIMWGGEWMRRRPGHDLENFTNATEIGRILDELEVDIVRQI